MFFNIPNTENAKTFSFFGSGASNTTIYDNSLIPWTKPPNINWIHIIAVGGGGRGGLGQSFASGTNAAGGGGGGPGGVTIFMAPSFIIPDTLYIKCGYGGKSNLSGALLVDGSPTYVTINQYTDNGTTGTVSSDSIIINAVGGNPGSTGNPGPGASRQTAASSFLSNPFGFSGFVKFFDSGAVTSGNAGAPGGSLASGTSISPYDFNYTSTFVMGGAGGGGKSGSPLTSYAGGDITDLETGSILVTGGRGVGGSGGSGHLRYKPLLGLGGAGGAGNANGTGGRGGDGGPGCGGGGGGGGVTGGLGGDGGPGFCLITCW